MYGQLDVEALEKQFNAAMEEADTGSALDAVRRIYDEFERQGEALAALLHRVRGADGDELPRRQDLQGPSRVQEVEKRHGGAVRGGALPAGFGSPPAIAGSSSAGSRSGRRTTAMSSICPWPTSSSSAIAKLARFTAYSDISAALDSVGLR